MVASIGCSLFLVGFLSRKPLSQIQGSTLLLIQEASHTPPFGGLGFRTREYFENRELPDAVKGE